MALHDPVSPQPCEVRSGDGSVVRIGDITAVISGAPSNGRKLLANLLAMIESGTANFESVATALQDTVVAANPQGLAAVLDGPQPVAFLFDRSHLRGAANLAGNGRSGWTTEVVPPGMVELTVGDELGVVDPRIELIQGRVGGTGTTLQLMGNRTSLTTAPQSPTLRDAGSDAPSGATGQQLADTGAFDTTGASSAGHGAAGVGAAGFGAAGVAAAGLTAHLWADEDAAATGHDDVPPGVGADDDASHGDPTPTGTQYDPPAGQYDPAGAQPDPDESQYSSSPSQYDPAGAQPDPDESQYEPAAPQHEPAGMQYSSTTPQHEPVAGAGFGTDSSDSPGDSDPGDVGFGSDPDRSPREPLTGNRGLADPGWAGSTPAPSDQPWRQPADAFDDIPSTYPQADDQPEAAQGWPPAAEADPFGQPETPPMPPVAAPPPAPGFPDPASAPPPPGFGDPGTAPPPPPGFPDPATPPPPPPGAFPMGAPPVGPAGAGGLAATPPPPPPPGVPQSMDPPGAGAFGEPRQGSPIPPIPDAPSGGVPPIPPPGPYSAAPMPNADPRSAAPSAPMPDGGFDHQAPPMPGGDFSHQPPPMPGNDFGHQPPPMPGNDLGGNTPPLPPLPTRDVGTPIPPVPEGYLSEQMPSMPDNLSDRIPGGLSDQVPDNLTDRIPGGLSDQVPDGLTDKLGLPDSLSGKVTDKLPSVPDSFSDRIPPVPGTGDAFSDVPEIPDQLRGPAEGVSGLFPDGSPDVDTDLSGWQDDNRD